MPPENQTVLIIDDERAIRYLCYRVLRQAGYLCLEAQGAFEAMQVGRNYKGQIDLLVTDFSLPGGLNGRHLARQLMTLHPHLKTLYISGLPEKFLIQTGLLEAGLAYLNKPFAPEELLDKAHDLLSPRLNRS